jgi:hypothetical protein
MVITYNFFQNLQDFLDNLLQNLDPALFQNIILGVLTIFIPFAIVFFTDILNSKNKQRTEFEKMVLSDEVLGTKKVFWLSIFGIVFFAFFSGVDTSTTAKIVAIFVAIFLIFFLSKPFYKILKFSEGNLSEFEISFLKKLSFSKIFNFKNKSKEEKMFRAWKSFWSESSEFYENDFTKVFIQHIDDAIKFKKFNLAVALGDTYVRNIKKRNPFLINKYILPKILEWHEIFWNERKSLQRHNDTEKQIQKNFFRKFFLRFGDLITKLFKKSNAKEEDFGRWYFFGIKFFNAIIETLLKDVDGPYQLFKSFKEHIEKREKELEKITDEQKKQSNLEYINKLFNVFCPTFFNKINSAQSSYHIWEHDFPSEWKITIANKDNRMAHIILDEFLLWSTVRIFKKENEENVDMDLTEVIKGIFPNVHSSLFTAFLMLYFSVDIKDAIEKERNFYISGVSVTLSAFVEESEEEMDKRLAEMMKKREISQKEETIQIILKFFPSWPPLTFCKDDLSEDESKNWESYTEEERKLIVRKKKLEKIKAEIESEEIKKICEGSERKEFYRKVFLELIELLIKEIEEIVPPKSFGR